MSRSVLRSLCARLALLAGLAVAAVALALNLDAADRAGAEGAGADMPAGDRWVATAPQVRVDAQTALQRVADRVAATDPTRPHVRATGTRAGAVVDESQPHDHVVDPVTGGLLSVADASGVVPAAEDLGPVHADPLPEGASLDHPTDTASLLERAATASSAASSGQPLTAEAGTPTGTPQIKTLSKHVMPSCSGTGSDGHRVQVLYVREADTANRFSQVLPVLRHEVANVDDAFAVSAEQTGGLRRVRWVHDADCLPVIKSVTVPDGALGTDFWKTVDAVKAQGYTSASRKYLMFADANALCGVGTVYSDTSQTNNANDGRYASYSRVDANCWSTSSSVAAHELVHNLGGVLASAPHATKNGHCYDDYDLMCYDDGSGVAMKRICSSSHEKLLDCNKDDYFNTAPAAGSFLAKSWNTARSSFLDSALTPPPGTPAPDVALSGSSGTAQTGDTVTFTASSSKTVTWTWTVSATACALTPSGRTATLVCPSTVTGPVTVTAKATETATGATGATSATVGLTKAAAPTAVVSAPASAPAGQPFSVTVTPTGKASFTQAWTAAGCTVAAPGAASTTVTCPSAKAGQAVGLGVRVTQRDGQQVTRSATVTITAAVQAGGDREDRDDDGDDDGDDEQAAPTGTRWVGAYASGGRVSATLRDAEGQRVTGRRVALQVKWRGASAWTTLSTHTTSALGQAITRPAATRAGWFRFATTADASYAASTSRSVYVKVRTRVRAATARRSISAQLLTERGTAVRGAGLQLQRWVSRSVGWRTVASTRTGSTGRVSRPVSRTAYYRWVYRGDVAHQATATGSVRYRR